mmetsp:Transcript_20884/g.44611  ORF Transcript_20884/g.44611 Transcript_20884/m.44611 type:complete len:816 (+) Transcript_20884:107-2554(+)
MSFSRAMKTTAASAVLMLVQLGSSPSSLAEAAKLLSQQRQAQLESAWSKELEEAPKERVNPVKRVVTLLQKMKTQLDEEANKESEMYDKMVCWCQTTSKEKAQAIAGADTKEQSLMAEIEERSASSGKLTSAASQGAKEVSDSQEALDTSVALREKEVESFQEADKELVQAITNLKNAIAVLKKHQKGEAMLQTNDPIFTPLRVLLHDCALKYQEIVAGREESQGEAMSMRRFETSFLALKASTKTSSAASTESMSQLLAAMDSGRGNEMIAAMPPKFAAQLVASAANKSFRNARTFLQMVPDAPSYASASGGIYGVLTQMLEDFEKQLAAGRSQEEVNKGNFEALKETKTAEIAASQKKLDQTQVEGADNTKALADAKEDLAKTRSQRSADVTVLQNLKVTCNDLDSKWQERSETRAAETKAVSEAIRILTEDESRELLAKSISFVQLRKATDSSSARRARAAAAVRSLLGASANDDDDDDEDLLAEWHKSRSPLLAPAQQGGQSNEASLVEVNQALPAHHAQLSALALSMQIDSFEKVKAMMDKMAAQLKKEQAEEVKFKEYCHTQLDETESAAQKKAMTKSDLEAKVGLLEGSVQKLGQEIAATKEQIKATALEVKKAGQSREEANAEFQAVVADQRAAQAILKKALLKLKDFYGKKNAGPEGVALLQTQHDQAPPVQFSDYSNNAGASPVISLMEQIIKDSGTLEGEAMTGESKSQAEYEQFVADGKALTKELQGAIVSKSDAAAAAKLEAAAAAEDLESTTGELKALAELEADLHAECDFTLKNFEVRQKARLAELESLQAAKAILSGAK